MDDRIAWVFSVGQGHYTQFQNFRECAPEDVAARSNWTPLHYEHPEGVRLSRLERTSWVPYRVRRRAYVRRQVAEAIGAPGVAALFYAGIPQAELMPVLRRRPTYYYMDSPGFGAVGETMGAAYGETRNPLVARWKYSQESIVLRACRGVFCMSEWAARGVRERLGWGEDRVRVALPGANLRRWSPIDWDARPTGSPTRILFVGGEFTRKGGPELLAWAERTRSPGWEIDIATWPNQLPPWAAAVVAQGTDEGNGIPLAPRLPHVRVHTGLSANSERLVQLYQQADLFCLPTRADFSPLAIMESLASGLPVVASAIGGIPEQIDDGVTGLLIGNGRSLDDALDELLSDVSRRRAMGAAARRSCEVHLNVERQVREIAAQIQHDVGRAAA